MRIRSSDKIGHSRFLHLLLFTSTLFVSVVVVVVVVVAVVVAAAVITLCKLCRLAD